MAGALASVEAPRRVRPVSGKAQAGASRTTDDALRLRLDGGPKAAGTARRALGRLRIDVEPPVLETMRLLVTELIANSVKHAQTLKVDLRVLVGRGSVVVEVDDEGPGFEPRGRAEGQDETSGWGLFLVDRMADRWGVSREGATTRVWFELKR
jgi:anti-sigma regulatory factor (Ser/Thr protein kinase)